MPRIPSWPDDEFESRSHSLAALIRKIWRAIARQIAAGIETQHTVPMATNVPIVVEWRDALNGQIIGYIENVYLDAAGHVADALQLSDDQRIGDDLVEYHVNEARNRLVGIGDDVWQIVQQQITMGNEAGEAVADIAARIRNVTGVSLGRSLTIARTEVHAAFEAGSYEQALFVDPDAEKVWIATNDERTRPSHRAADGQAVKIGESFIVGGTKMRFPGDPLGAPSEGINCRCTTAYNFDMITSMDEDMTDESAMVAAGQAWKPHLHPRGNDGKFIKSGIVADFLKKSKLYIFDVKKVVENLDSAQWSKLTAAQKSYIKDAVDKLPKGTATHKSAQNTIDSLEKIATAKADKVSTPADTGVSVTPKSSKLTHPDTKITETIDKNGNPLDPESEAFVALNAPTLDAYTFWEAAANISPDQWKKLTNAQQTKLINKADDLDNESDHEANAAVDHLTHLSDTYMSDPSDASTAPTMPTPQKSVDVSGPTAPKADTAPKVNATPTKNIAPVAPTTSTKIPDGLKGKPGDPAKVTTSVIWGKHAPGTVVLDTANGSEQVVWNGKKYDNIVEGEVYASWTKKDAYAQLKNDAHWVIPGGNTQVSTTPIAPTAAPSVAKKQLDDIAENAGKPAWTVSQDFSGLKKVGSQAGSNPGGKYKASDGTEWYIKKPKSADHAANEIAASAFYNLAGINAPQVMKGKGAPDLGGTLQTGTKIVPGAKANLSDKLNDKDYIKEIQSGFAIDAWLANWDVAGTGYDNIVQGADGKPYRIDVGGALLFRAQGKPKGTQFGDTVIELDTLRDQNKNSYAASIFGSMTDDDIRESIKRLEAISDDDIDRIVSESGLPSDIAKTLKARRQDVINKYATKNDTVLQSKADTTPVTQTPTTLASPPPIATVPMVAGDTMSLKQLHVLIVMTKHPNGTIVGIAHDDTAQIMWSSPQNSYVVHDLTTGVTTPIGTIATIKRLRSFDKKFDIPAKLVPGGKGDFDKKATPPLLSDTQYDDNDNDFHEPPLASQPTKSSLLYDANTGLITLTEAATLIEQLTIDDFNTLSPAQKYAIGSAVTNPNFNTLDGGPKATMKWKKLKLDWQLDKGLITYDEYNDYIKDIGDNFANDVSEKKAPVNTTNYGAIIYALESKKPIYSIDGKWKLENNPNGKLGSEFTLTEFGGTPKDDKVWFVSNAGTLHDLTGNAVWSAEAPKLTKEAPIVTKGVEFKAGSPLELENISTDVDNSNYLDGEVIGVTADGNSQLVFSDDYGGVVYQTKTNGGDGWATVDILYNSYNGPQIHDQLEDEYSHIKWFTPEKATTPTNTTVPNASVPDISDPEIPIPGKEITLSYIQDEIAAGTFGSGGVIAISDIGNTQLVWSGLDESIYVQKQGNDGEWNSIDVIPEDEFDTLISDYSDISWHEPVYGAPSVIDTNSNTLQDKLANITPLSTPDAKPHTPWHDTYKAAPLTPGEKTFYLEEISSQSAYPGEILHLLNGENGLSATDVNNFSEDELDVVVKQINEAIAYNMAGAHEAHANWLKITSSSQHNTATAKPSVPEPAIATPSDPTPTPTPGASPTYVTLAHKAAIKAFMKDAGAGYWSKPEKIWDVIKAVKAKPGWESYTPMDIIKALDSQLKTQKPNPYEEKMVKWASTWKGSLAVGKSGLGSSSTTAPSTSSTPNVPKSTSSVTKSISVTAINSDNIDAVWAAAQEAPVNTVLATGKSGEFTDYRMLVTANPSGGSSGIAIQYKDGSKWYTYELLSSKSELSLHLAAQDNTKEYGNYKWKPTADAKISGSIAPEITSPDVSGISELSQQSVYQTFKNQGIYLSSTPGKVYDGILETSKAHNLSLSDTIAIIDAFGAKKANAPNGNLFYKKISDWLGTPAGVAHLLNEPEKVTGLPSPPPYLPQFDPQKTLPSFEESNKYKYDYIPSVSAASALWKDVVANTEMITPDQQKALKTWTGGAYTTINTYYFKPNQPALSPVHKGAALGSQKGMRPVDRPVVLVRGTGYSGIGNAKNHAQLEKMIGQTWRNNAFAATSVGTDGAGIHAPAFANHPLWIEFECPPGTPMAWLDPFSSHPGEREMLLGANLHYKILSVEKKNIPGYGLKSIARVRIVPKPEGAADDE